MHRSRYSGWRLEADSLARFRTKEKCGGEKKPEAVQTQGWNGLTGRSRVMES